MYQRNLRKNLTFADEWFIMYLVIIMLISFSVNNFLSFYDTQELSMEAGKYRNNSNRLKKYGKHKLLKFLSIYGANASGKSNLVTALGFFQSIVVESFRTGSYPLYCRVNEENKEKTSLFEVKLLLDGKIFVYGFKSVLSKSIFTEEWLYEELQNGSRRSIFTRDIQNSAFLLGEYITSSKHIERLKIYGEDIKSDETVLFLKLMNQNKSSLYDKSSKLDVFKRVFSWIKYDLDVNSPENPITNYSILNDSESIEEITKKLSDFSTGIVKFEIVPVTEDKISANIPNDMIKEIQQRLLDQKNQHPEIPDTFKPAVLIRMPERHNMYIIELNNELQFEFKTMSFKHENSEATFALSDESDGTVRLLDIIEVLLKSNENRTYVIDEINRKFHPLLTLKFIEEFLMMAEKRNVQLIVTTHESQLMDLKLLRRDEISFVNKDNQGYSSIYSLDSYDVRFDKKIVTEYLKGHYNAVPNWVNNKE